MFCWFFRLMISHSVDADTQPSPITGKHIRHCADCCQFYNTCLSLGECLTREATVSKPWVSKHPPEHILAAMPRRRTETHRLRLKLRPMIAAACVALLILTAVFFLLERRDERGVTQYSRPLEELRNLVGQDFTKAWPQLIERPLADELENLTDNTESAVRFLVACVAVDIPGTAANQ